MKRGRLLPILGAGAAVMLAVMGAGDAVAGVGETIAARASFAASGTKTLSVPATTTFMGTGVTLRSGESALITAKGTISYNSGNPACGGSGITPNGCAAERICPVAGGCGALIGRLGSGAPFLVGTRKTVEGPGALALGINDAPGTFGDNSGAFTVTIETATPTTPPRPSAAKAKAAVAWTQTQVGSARWTGKCERFVEVAYGARTGYANAAVAARRIGLRSGPIASVPRGALIYFRPNCPGATGKAGHVGIALGGGRMISALGVVKITDLNKSSPWTTAYTGWAYPPTEWPGRRP